MARNLTGGLPVLYQGRLANLGPFQERLTPAQEKRQKGDAEWHRSAGLQNGQQGKCSDAWDELVCNAMHMKTWQNAAHKQMTWQRRWITGRHLAHRIRGVTQDLLVVMLTMKVYRSKYYLPLFQNSSSGTSANPCFPLRRAYLFTFMLSHCPLIKKHQLESTAVICMHCY